MPKSRKRKHSRSRSRERSRDDSRKRNNSDGKLQKMQDQLDNLTNAIMTIVKERETQTVSDQSNKQIDPEINIGMLIVICFHTKQITVPTRQFHTNSQASESIRFRQGITNICVVKKLSTRQFHTNSRALESIRFQQGLINVNMFNKNRN